MTLTCAEPRNEFIKRVVAGRTFAEVGGVWEIVNEKVSVAKNAGAVSVAMLDAIPQDHPMWKAFLDHVRKLGINDLGSYAPINLDTLDVAAVGGPYDVVHCSGVLYHCPNPLHSLSKLAALAKEHVIITSCVVEPVVACAAGRIELPEGAALSVPALGEEQFAIVSGYWRERGVPSIVVMGEGQRRLDWDVKDYGPWWWLYTPATMEGMMRAVGLDPIEGVTWWEGRAHTVLARKRRGDAPRQGSFGEHHQSPVAHGEQKPEPAKAVAANGAAEYRHEEGEREGYDHEMAFWDLELSLKGQFAHYTRMRLEPSLRHQAFPQPLMVQLDAARDTFPQQRLQVLDVGSGPVTNLVWGFEQGLYDLIAADPLGERYCELLVKHRINFPAPPVTCRAEDLLKQFGPNRFHVVYSRNALDHAEDIQRCFGSIAAVLKPGGRFILEVLSCEGEREGYVGLHGYNFTTRAGELGCHDRNGCSKLSTARAGLQTVTVWPPEVTTPGTWLMAVFEKPARG